MFKELAPAMFTIPLHPLKKALRLVWKWTGSADLTICSSTADSTLSVPSLISSSASPSHGRETSLLLLILWWRFFYADGSIDKFLSLSSFFFSQGYECHPVPR